MDNCTQLGLEKAQADKLEKKVQLLNKCKEQEKQQMLGEKLYHKRKRK
jgi:hypothetical protein